MRKLVMLLLLSTTVMFSQGPVPDGRLLWTFSVFSLAAANALDAHSSWGKHELNPALVAGPSARFGSRGLLLKIGFQGSLIGLEYLILRGHRTGRMSKTLAFVNFGAAAATSSVAAHNYTIGR